MKLIVLLLLSLPVFSQKKINIAPVGTSPATLQNIYFQAPLYLINDSTVGITTAILTGTASLSFGTAAALGSTELTISVSGADIGDIVGVNPSSFTGGTSVYIGVVKTANVVTIRKVNVSNSTDFTPSSTTFTVKVFKD